MEPRQLEIDQNYDFFQRQLKSLLPVRRGQFVLLHGRSIVDYFDGPGDAYRAGLVHEYEPLLYPL